MKTSAPSSPPASLWQKFRRVHLLPLLLLGALPWLLYSHTLHFETVLDDEAYVMQNPLIKDPRSFLFPFEFGRFINSYLTSGVLSDLPVNFVMRPVTYLTFFINHSLGGVETAGYRLVNISLHMLNGILLFFLALRLTGRRGVALLTALLFAAHPLATESVTYIAQRFELMVTAFTLAALLSWMSSRESAGRARLAWAGGSLLCTLLAMLSKETGFLVPVLLLGLELMQRREPLKKSLWALRGHLLLMPLLPSLIVACQWADTQRASSLIDALHITNVGPVRFEVMDYAMTQVCAWMSYLRLILLPVGQSFDHDYPLITSALDGRFLMSAATTALLLGLAAWWFRRSRAHGFLAFAGLLWYFLTLAPSSSIVPLPDVFSEHRSYLPSVGVMLALAGVWMWMSKVLSSDARAWAPACVALVSALVVATLVRNEVMRTRESIWLDALAKGSERARVLKGLGIAAHNAGRTEEAVGYFRRATEKHPEDLESWTNYCTILTMNNDRVPEALAATEAALKHWGTVVPLVHLRAVALSSAGQLHHSEQLWRSILEAYPNHRHASLGLAHLMMHAGRKDEAMRHLRAAERTGPLPEPHASMKKALMNEFASLP